METYIISMIGFVILLINGSLGEGNIGRGFGENIDWLPLEDGLQAAKDNNKPLMLVIHKTWCGACKALKPKFAASEEIQELSSKFVMVNVEDDEEPEGEEYKPDGGYIPRILFLNPEGEVQEDLINTIGNPKYKYYYSSSVMVTEAMKSALTAFGGGGNLNEEL